MAISSGEMARAEQPDAVDLIADAPAVPGAISRRRCVSVVVPLLNEEATLERLYEELEAALAATGLDWEVVFVDDGSTDGSYRELVRLHAAHLNVRVVRLRRNFGKAAALAAGIEVAAGDVIVTMDADLQDDPGRDPEPARRSSTRASTSSPAGSATATTRSSGASSRGSTTRPPGSRRGSSCTT